MFRIISLGITGFDSPVAGNSLQEAHTVVGSIRHNLESYHTRGQAREEPLRKCDAALQFLSQHRDPNRFDRLLFIRQYLDPLSRAIVALQHARSIPVFTEPRMLSAATGSLFDKGIFDADYYTPGLSWHSNPEKVALGKRLFYDSILSGSGRRSCASCHDPGRAFTDAQVTSLSLDGRGRLKRNAPTLINSALQPALFYDMRVNFLEDQAKDVISNRDEMHGSLERAVRAIGRNSSYRKMFEAAYKGEPLSELQVRNSIAAYVRTLVGLNARFDQYMRGQEGAMNQLERDGFNIFTGKAKCATCHFLPLFNGSNPPQFDKIDAEVIGVPGNADTLHPVRDEDPGKFNLYGIDLHKYAFKTPTLRNIALTAPYMHNGVFRTLEEVIQFYNRGGGKGLGLPVDNQTLPAERLDLSEYEKKSLVAFLHTLTDTTTGR